MQATTSLAFPLTLKPEARATHHSPTSIEFQG
jgi:hypothetical protein